MRAHTPTHTRTCPHTRLVEERAAFAQAHVEQLPGGQATFKKVTFERPQPISLKNVCVSSRDGILIPAHPSIPVGGAGPQFDGNGWFAGLDDTQASTTFKPRVLDWANFSKHPHVRYIAGRSAYVNCFRCQYNCRNPAHFLMGYSQLFQGILLKDIPGKLSTLVFHQCPPRHLFELGSLYWMYPPFATRY